MSTSETDTTKAERALRLLSGGARSLRPMKARAEWGVFPQGDRRRRPMVLLEPMAFDLLRSRGDIVPSGRSRDEWVAQLPDTLASQELSAPGLKEVTLAGNHAKTASRGFAGMVEQALRDEGHLDRRSLLAAKDFTALWEIAHLSQSITQDWSMVITDGGGMRADGLAPMRVMKARRQLSSLEQTLGAKQWSAIRLAVIDGASLRRIERQLGWRSGLAPRRIGEALSALADALDQGERRL